MKNLWSLLAVAAHVTNHVLAEHRVVSEADDVATSNVRLGEDSSTNPYSTSSDNIKQRSIPSFSSSRSWQYITRPQIKHTERSALIQGDGNQQAIVLAESTPMSKCVPSTTLAEIVTCFPVVDASHFKSAEVCKTTFSETKGCDMKLSPSTTSITASTMTLGCAQDSCGKGGCGGNTRLEQPSGVKCKGCTTSEGLVYAPQSTAPASSAKPVTNPSPSLGSTAADASSSTPAARKSLGNRTLVEPKDFENYDNFVLSELAKARADDGIVPHRIPDPNQRPETNGRSSARIWNFHSEPQTFAVERLYGCTVIILTSRRGLWMSHHWEDPTFVSHLGLPSSVEKDIEVGMFLGDNSGWYPGINEIYRAGDIFDTGTYGRTQNRIRPIIYTPYGNPDFWGGGPSWKHQKDIIKIQNLLMAYFGPDVRVVTYIPVEGSDAVRETIFDTTARGKILVQFDPTNLLMTEKHKVGDDENVCYEQRAVVRIWGSDDQDPIYEDNFEALPEQISLINLQQLGKRGREDQIDWSQPYCGAVNSTSTSTSSVHTKTGTSSKHSSSTSKTNSDCTVISAPATTIPAHTLSGTVTAAHTVSADTYCQCGKTIAGIETKTGSDGSISLYCNNGSKGHTKPDMTSPPASTCYITSASATTIPDKTIGSSVSSDEIFPAATYCQCGKTVAGIITSTGHGGGKTVYCATGSGTSRSAVSHSLSPTACKLTSAPATTIGSQTFPKNTYCQCGDEIVGLSTNTGDDGGATVFCVSGSGREAAPVTTITPTSVLPTSMTTHTSTPVKAQVCHLHLYEATRSDQKPGAYSLSGGSGVHLYVNGQERYHVETYNAMSSTLYITPAVSGLEKNIAINLGFVIGDELPKQPVAGNVPSSNTADSVKDFTDYLVFVGYGNGTWSTQIFAGNNDTGHIPFLGGDNYPYFGIGGWDTTTVPHRPNRNLDCYFEC